MPINLTPMFLASFVDETLTVCRFSLLKSSSLVSQRNHFSLQQPKSISGAIFCTQCEGEQWPKAAACGSTSLTVACLLQTVSDPSRDSRRVGVAELSDLQPDGPVCRHQEAVGRTARKLPPQPPPSCSSASYDPLVPSSKQVQSVRLRKQDNRLVLSTRSGPCPSQASTQKSGKARNVITENLED